MKKPKMHGTQNKIRKGNVKHGENMHGQLWNDQAQNRDWGRREEGWSGFFGQPMTDWRRELASQKAVEVEIV